MKTFKEVVIETLVLESECSNEDQAIDFIEMNQWWFNFLEIVSKNYANYRCKDILDDAANNATCFDSGDYDESDNAISFFIVDKQSILDTEIKTP